MKDGAPPVFSSEPFPLVNNLLACPPQKHEPSRSLDFAPADVSIPDFAGPARSQLARPRSTPAATARHQARNRFHARARRPGALRCDGAFRWERFVGLGGDGWKPY